MKGSEVLLGIMTLKETKSHIRKYFINKNFYSLLLEKTLIDIIEKDDEQYKLSEQQ